MKNYRFFFAIMTAALLCGCNMDSTVTVVYTDVPPPLTQMSYSEKLPPETYSQYMATYTPTSETGTSGYTVSRLQADTGITAITAGNGGAAVTAVPIVRDTAITAITTSVTEAEPSETSVPDDNEETPETVTCSAETSETTEETTPATLARPKADTVAFGKISADTTPTPYEPTETESGEISESETGN